MYILPFTVNTPELLSLPTTFSARQVYVPASDVSGLIIVSEPWTLPGTPWPLKLYLSLGFITASLKYQLILGVGSPIASQVNNTILGSFSVATLSVTSTVICGESKQKYFNAPHSTLTASLPTYTVQ